MFGQIQLTFEDVTRLTTDADTVFYKNGSKFVTTKDAMLKRCIHLTDNQKVTIQQFPDKAPFVLENVSLGTFELLIGGR